MKDTSNIFTEDDTFVKLRSMSFEEALDLAIQIYESFPEGTSTEERMQALENELMRYGWSYSKIQNQAYARNDT